MRPQRSRLRWTGVLLAAASCAAGLAACGGSSPAGTTSTTPPITPSTSTSVSQVPVTPGVASNGVTSKQVCGFLTSVLVTQMLAGSHPDGAGTPQSYNGEAACTWADMAGNDFTVTVSANSGVIGCNGAAGTALHVSGWQGCYAPTAFVAYGSEGQDYVSVAYDFGGQAESLEPAQEAVITHVLQELHA